MYRLLIYLLITFILTTCSQPTTPPANTETDSNVVDSLRDTRFLNINNTLFSIPSPHLITATLKKQNVEYNPEYINAPNNLRNYTNSYKKALNLGVYGSDIGYLTLYEKTQEALTYFSIVKTLVYELGIINHLKNSTLLNIEKKMSNPDTLINILALAYQDIDTFLKSNDQEHIGVLILAGGWIESMYLLTQFAENKNIEIVTLLGENRNPLKNLIRIISPYTETNRIYQTLFDKLAAIELIYQDIEIRYTYIKKDVYLEEKTTKIYSNTHINISNDMLTALLQEIKALRHFITS